MPASPAMVCAYLTDRAGDGLSVGTLDMDCGAISGSGSAAKASAVLCVAAPRAPESLASGRTGNATPPLTAGLQPAARNPG